MSGFDDLRYVLFVAVRAWCCAFELYLDAEHFANAVVGSCGLSEAMTRALAAAKAGRAKDVPRAWTPLQQAVFAVAKDYANANGITGESAAAFAAEIAKAVTVQVEQCAQRAATVRRPWGWNPWDGVPISGRPPRPRKLKALYPC